LLRTSGGVPDGKQHLASMIPHIALSVWLLVGAGLFSTSFRLDKYANVGFDIDQVLTASFELGTLSSGDAAQILEQAIPRIEALPGVEAAGRGRIQPYYFFTRTPFTILDGRDKAEQPASVLMNSVDAEYFRSLGIRPTSGRLIAAHDRENTDPVAVVSQAIALRYWHGDSPIGSCIQFPNVDAACVRVVGVASDVRFEQLRGEASEIVYVPASQELGEPP